MFQEHQYVGGFDADECAFCFSAYLADGEYWFQLSIEQVRAIAQGSAMDIEIRRAED